MAISGTAADRVLREELRGPSGLSSPDRGEADPASSAHVRGAVEPERIDFLRAAGPWLPYREIVTVLGWWGPAARAYSIGPLLAKAVLDGRAAHGHCPEGDWRRQATGAGGTGKGLVHYRWEGCLGALRRGAVLYESLAASVSAETLGVRLHTHAGF